MSSTKVVDTWNRFFFLLQFFNVEFHNWVILKLKSSYQSHLLKVFFKLLYTVTRHFDKQKSPLDHFSKTQIFFLNSQLLLVQTANFEPLKIESHTEAVY